MFARPLTVEQATDVVAGWLERPNVGIVHPTIRHWEVVGEMARSGMVRGTVLVDAHLATLAIEHGATLCTTDRDFARFKGLRFEDPIGDS